MKDLFLTFFKLMPTLDWIFTVIDGSIFFICRGVKSILHYLFNFKTKLNPTPGNKSFPVNLYLNNKLLQFKKDNSSTEHITNFIIFLCFIY